MTQQIRDTLIYENHKFYLNVELIEQYFREFPEKRPDLLFQCTALWRGYIAEFEIKDNALCINKFDWLADIDFNMKSFRQEIFPENKFKWYSGLIRIDDFRGKFDSEPENGIFEYLEIIKGNFKQKRIFNYSELQEFKREQFEYFLMSEEMEKIYDFWRINNEHEIINKENINGIILENIMEYTREVFV